MLAYQNIYKVAGAAMQSGKSRHFLAHCLGLVHGGAQVERVAQGAIAVSAKRFPPSLAPSK